MHNFLRWAWPRHFSYLVTRGWWQLFVDKSLFLKNQISNVYQPIFLVFLLESLGLEESPESLLEQWINKQQNSKYYPVVVNKLSDMNLMGDHDSTDLEEKHPIDCNEKIGTDS